MTVISGRMTITMIIIMMMMIVMIMMLVINMTMLLLLMMVITMMMTLYVYGDDVDNAAADDFDDDDCNKSNKLDRWTVSADVKTSCRYPPTLRSKDCFDRNLCSLSTTMRW